MKNIGIFLAYSPEQSIRGHGISRLLSFILQGILENNDTRVTIATPEWFKQNIMEFLQEEKINVSKIELITTKRIPYVIRLRQLLKQTKKSSLECLPPINPSLRGAFFATKQSSAFRRLFLDYFVAKNAPRNDGLALLKKYCGKVRRTLISRFRRETNPSAGEETVAKQGFFALPTAELRKISILRKLYRVLRNRELNKLVSLVNQRKDISVWFTPALFWPEIKDICAQKIVAAPDVVLVEFPAYFTDAESQETYKKVAATIATSDHFICYSDHVKQNHLVKSFSVAPDKVSVIPHGAIDLSNHVTTPEAALHVLQNYQKNTLQNNPYLADFDFTEMRYIFYSSQLRPYKNFRHLITAYEKLLRERFVNIKLIVTADITADPELYNYILSKRLQFDVLSFHDVPGDVLAALYRLAICVVNPTLFEGGFPFTFTEAYSVGTPSVMSAIPVVLAEIDQPHLQQAMLFDPHNIDDMVNKIEWAVNHSTELFTLQKPLYQRFQQRCWGTVAKDYVNLFKQFT